MTNESHVLFRHSEDVHNFDFGVISFLLKSSMQFELLDVSGVLKMNHYYCPSRERVKSECVAVVTSFIQFVCFASKAPC